MISTTVVKGIIDWKVRSRVCMHCRRWAHSSSLSASLLSRIWSVWLSAVPLVTVQWCLPARLPASCLVRTTSCVWVPSHRRMPTSAVHTVAFPLVRTWGTFLKFADSDNEVCLNLWQKVIQIEPEIILPCTATWSVFGAQQFFNRAVKGGFHCAIA